MLVQEGGHLVQKNSHALRGAPQVNRPRTAPSSQTPLLRRRAAALGAPTPTLTLHRPSMTHTRR